MAAERVEARREADQVARDQPRALVDQLVEAVLPVRPGLAPVTGPVSYVDRRRVDPRRSCRSTPSSAAGGRRGSAPGTGRRAARRRSARRRSPCTRRRAGPSAPAGSRRAARCGSARPSRGSRRAAARSRQARSRASSRGRSRSPSSSGRRPSPRTRTRWRCRSRTPPRPRGSSRPRRSGARPPTRRRRARRAASARAVVAFVIVSSVVNVFEQTMNSVSAGSRSRVASTKSVPSTFETKRNVMSRAAVVAQRAVGHHRPEVGAADADVDDVGDRPPGRALPLAGADGVGERAHPVEHLVHLGDDVDAVDDERAFARHPQRHVQHGAVLGDVDLLAGEHRVAPLGDAGLLRERDEAPHRLVGDAVLRVVEEEPGRLAGEPLGAAGVGGEEVAQVHVPHARGVRSSACQADVARSGGVIVGASLAARRRTAATHPTSCRPGRRSCGRSGARRPADGGAHPERACSCTRPGSRTGGRAGTARRR